MQNKIKDTNSLWQRAWTQFMFSGLACLFFLNSIMFD